MEFYESFERDNTSLYSEIEEALEIKLPVSFTELYNMYSPIDVFDCKYYLQEVLFEDSNSIIRTERFKDLRLGEIYSLSKIIDRLQDDSAEINPFRTLKMLPIAEGATYHGGVLMDENGLFFYTMDFYEYTFQDDKSKSIIASDLNELISRFMIIPMDLIVV